MDVHFEDATSGFFIRETVQDVDTTQHTLVSEPGTTDNNIAPATPDSRLQENFVTNLTLFGAHQVASVQASYGPFLSRQTIAASNFLGERFKSDCKDILQ